MTEKRCGWIDATVKLFRMTALLLLAQLSGQPVDCSLLNAQQRQGLNCAPAPQAPAPPPSPPNTPNPTGFYIGHTYRRTATGTRLFIMSLGRDANGFYMYTGQCLDERTEDHCYAVGWPRLLEANLSTSGWEDLGPYPDVRQF